MSYQPHEYFEWWHDIAMNNNAVERDDATRILTDPAVPLLPLVYQAGSVRKHYHGDRVTVHVLDNVQNGACPEDCGYCGQSKDSKAPIQPYKLKTVEAIVKDAEAAKASGAFRFCMALSGRGPDERDIDHMCEAIARIKAMGMRTCLSAGLLDEEKAVRLKTAGLDRLNHNLNTSEGHYESICKTHSYADRMQTLAMAKKAGLGVCSGLIVGMNESTDDLVEVAYALKSINAESIPVNFLLPIEGNRVNRPLHNGEVMTPEFVLRVLCMFRYTNPSAEIRIAAGREYHLRSMQPLALYPANSLFMEGYLLTKGQGGLDTLRMILDAGFEPDLDGRAWPEELQRFISGQSEPAHGRDATVADITVNGSSEFKATVVKSRG